MKWTSVIIPFEHPHITLNHCYAAAAAVLVPTHNINRNLAKKTAIFKGILLGLYAHTIQKMTSIPHWIQSSMSNRCGLCSALFLSSFQCVYVIYIQKTISNFDIYNWKFKAFGFARTQHNVISIFKWSEFVMRTHCTHTYQVKECECGGAHERTH